MSKKKQEQCLLKRKRNKEEKGFELVPYGYNIKLLALNFTTKRFELQRIFF
jgi:hypothetical protein